jgi:toxin FitB
LNVVDSSAWLEYFADGPNADFFAPAIEDLPRLIVPTITIYEVFKRALLQTDESTALQAVAVMQEGRLVDLTHPLALRAAAISATEKLPMADSVILATARSYGATLWTQDVDFKELDGVKYLAGSKP